MGIKGLKHFLDKEENLHLHVREWVPHGSHLHIDANGWMFFAMYSAEGLAISRQHGGSYREYDRIIRTKYHSMISAGFSLSFYFDGVESSMRSAKKKDRSLQRIQSWLAIRRAISIGDPEPDQKTFDLPPLTKQQFVSTLESIGAHLVFCDYKADQAIALACRTANIQSAQSHYCFGDETDYIAMRDCPYIHFSTLRFEGQLQTENIFATVWRRDRLAINLGLSEQQLVEWFIFIGNEYTNYHLDQSPNMNHEGQAVSKKNISSLLDQNSGEERNECPLQTKLEFIRLQHPSFRVSSAYDVSENAIQYSRALYDLLDLTSYQSKEIMRSATNNASDGVHCYLLSDVEKVVLRHYQYCHVHSFSTASKQFEMIGQYIINFLQSNLNKLNGDTPETMSTYLFPHITNEHLEAFVQMLGHLNQVETSCDINSKEDAKFQLPIDASSDVHLNTGQHTHQSIDKDIENIEYLKFTSEVYLYPTWDDVRAAHTYQLLCKRFLEVLGKEHSLDTNRTIHSNYRQFQPMKLYDGETFHRAMATIRKDNEEVEINYCNFRNKNSKKTIDEDDYATGKQFVKKAGVTVNHTSISHHTTMVTEKMTAFDSKHSDAEYRRNIDIKLSARGNNRNLGQKVEISKMTDDRMEESHYSDVLHASQEELNALSRDKMMLYISQIKAIEPQLKEDMTILKANVRSYSDSLILNPMKNILLLLENLQWSVTFVQKAGKKESRRLEKGRKRNLKVTLNSESRAQHSERTHHVPVHLINSKERSENLVATFLHYNNVKLKNVSKVCEIVYFTQIVGLSMNQLQELSENKLTFLLAQIDELQPYFRDKKSAFYAQTQTTAMKYKWADKDGEECIEDVAGNEGWNGGKKYGVGEDGGIYQGRRADVLTNKISMETSNSYLKFTACIRNIIRQLVHLKLINKENDELECQNDDVKDVEDITHNITIIDIAEKELWLLSDCELTTLSIQIRAIQRDVHIIEEEGRQGFLTPSAIVLKENFTSEECFLTFSRETRRARKSVDKIRLCRFNRYMQDAKIHGREIKKCKPTSSALPSKQAVDKKYPKTDYAAVLKCIMTSSPPSLPSSLSLSLSLSPSPSPSLKHPAINPVGHQRTKATQSRPTSSLAEEILPIDEYKDIILRHTQRDRVTIVQGDTGCGKSSRLPLILLEHAATSNPPLPCRIMVSQPRRIAAYSLMKHLRTSIGMKVGLRMGNGVKDENEETVIQFATCGYMLRLMSHHPTYFSEHTHIIIDEVHERSVETDMLCMVTRKLMHKYPRIRLILMSATMQPDVFISYYADVMHPYSVESIFVGVRRYPVEYKYLKDVLSKLIKPKNIREKIEKLIKITSKCSGHVEERISYEVVTLQQEIFFALVHKIAKKDSAILVFVSGLSDMISLGTKFDDFPLFDLCYIHSEIPYEDQTKAFQPAPSGKIKIIIANNTAVSSITFPDVDTVVCFGTHKSLKYSQDSHGTYLANTWISKMTAIQRAGRTGRVRPGTVYRLYTEDLSARLDDEDVSEIFRRPLHDAILDLWAMTEGSDDFAGIIPTLCDLPETPTTENIEASLKTLYDYGMTSDSEGQGQMTRLGRFAGELPLDMRLSMLIHYGIALGFGAESIVFAAALSLQRSIFRKTNFTMKNDPTNFNQCVRISFLGSVQLDDGNYSDPVLHLIAFKKWVTLSKSEKPKWAFSLGIRMQSMIEFVNTVNLLLEKVDRLLGCVGQNGRRDYDSEENIDRERFMDTKSLDLSHAITARELNYFRLMLTWVSADNIIRQVKEGKVDNEVQLKKQRISVGAINELFPVCRKASIIDDKEWQHNKYSIPFEVSYEGCSKYTAMLSPTRLESSSDSLLRALLSALTGEKDKNSKAVKADIVWVVTQSSVAEGSKGNRRIERSAAVTIAITNKLYNDLLIMLPSFFDHGRTKQRSLSLLSDSEEISARKDVTGEHVTSGGKYNGSLYSNFSPPLDGLHTVLEVTNVSLPELEILTIFQAQRTPTAFLSISSFGQADAIITNYRVSKSSLRSIFFNQLGPSNCSSDAKVDDRSTEITGLTTMSQIISFPDVDIIDGDVNEEEEEFEGEEEEEVEEEETEDGNSFDEDDDESSGVLEYEGKEDEGVPAAATVTQSLSKPALTYPSVKVVHKIEDVSLGLRLMNSYRLAYQKGMIRVPKVHRYSPSYDEDDEDEVRVSGPIWAWHNITSGSGERSSSYVQAILPLHSVSAVAVHQGEESLYGVAFTSLHTLGNTNRMVSMVDGVTLLPPGGLWISLALSCIGYDPQSVIEFETTRFKELRMERQKQKLEVKAVRKVEKLKKNAKKSRKLLEEMMALQIGPNIGNYDFTPCHTVRRYIVQGADCIKRDDNLINLIDGIFKDWTDVDRQVKL